MSFSLIPCGVCRSVYELSGPLLADHGITLVLADLDNTLAKYGQPEPDEPLRGWLDDLRAHGAELFILSNSRKPTRAQIFSDSLGVPYLSHSGKPKTGGFRAALDRTGRRPEETLMVGDQIFTDVLGANLAGIRSCLIEPIELAGNPGRYLRYWAETPFRLLGRRRNHR